MMLRRTIARPFAVASHGVLRGLGLIELALVILLLTTGAASAQNLLHAYVVNEGSNTVSVLDTSNNTVVATIQAQAGAFPSDVAVAPSGQWVFVANPYTNNVSVIDPSTNSITATIPAGSYPFAMTVTPNSRYVYVANDNPGGTVTVIDTFSQNVVATIPVGNGPYGDAVTPDGTQVYVVNSSDYTVSVIDVASNNVIATIPLPSSLTPVAVAITPDGRHAYVVNQASNNVSVIDTSTQVVTTTIPVGAQPSGVTITPDGRYVYVPNANANTVSVINTSTNTVVATVAVGSVPLAVAVTADGLQVYVTNSEGGNVSVINVATNTVTATVSVGSIPLAVATQPRHTWKIYMSQGGLPPAIRMQATPAQSGLMTPTAPAPQNLTLSLLGGPSWFSEQAFTGTFYPGATFQFSTPCTKGLGVLVTYSVAATDLQGGSAVPLGSTSQLLSTCLGEQTVTIPVATSVNLNNQLLRFQISSLFNVNLSMSLGQNTYLQGSNYVGEP